MTAFKGELHQFYSVCVCVKLSLRLNSAGTPVLSVVFFFLISLVSVHL